MSKLANPLGLLACMIAVALVLAGCSNPDATGTTAASTQASPQSAGEPPAPAPPPPSAQSPAQVQPTPTGALTAFAERDVNWNWKTLAGDQRALAAIAVGAARLAEQQAAASSTADTTIASAEIWNRGTLVSVAPDRSKPGTWVLVTREQTGGDSQYEGLPAAYHVTLAELARVPGGWAVERWSPQS